MRTLPADDKVAFLLAARLLIEQWTPARASRCRVGNGFRQSGRGRTGTPEIVNDGTFAYPLYGINLAVPNAGSSQVLVALGWTHGDLLKLSQTHPKALPSTTR